MRLLVRQTIFSIESMAGTFTHSVHIILIVSHGSIVQPDGRTIVVPNRDDLRKSPIDLVPDVRK